MKNNGDILLSFNLVIMLTREEILLRIQEQLRRPPAKAAPPEVVPPRPSAVAEMVGPRPLIDQPDAMKEIWERTPAELEVEIGFGYTMQPHHATAYGTFVPGLFSISQFSSLKKSLTEELGSAKYEETLVEIDKDERIRKITWPAENVDRYERKERTRNIANQIWGYSLYVSRETILERPPVTFTVSVKRKRQRYTFEQKDPAEKFYGIIFDLTIVNEQVRNARFGWSKGRVKYEVEIERSKTVASSFGALAEAIEFVITRSQGVLTLENAMSLEERDRVVRYHNGLFAAYLLANLKLAKSQEERDKIKNDYDALVNAPGPYLLVKDYWNKPQNIKIQDLLFLGINEYYVTPKLDGTRRFLLITKEGVYLLSPPTEIKRVMFLKSPLAGSLYDGELYERGGDDKDEYFLFDTLFYKSEDVRTKKLVERLEHIPSFLTNIQSVDMPPETTSTPLIKSEDESLETTPAPLTKFEVGQWRPPVRGKKPKFQKVTVTKINIPSNLSIKQKQFFTSQFPPDKENTIYDSVNYAFEYVTINTDYVFDGIIFQPPGEYYNEFTKKWKPANLLTIDFLLLPTPEEGEHVFSLMAGGRGRAPEQFFGDTSHQITGLIYVENSTFNDESVANRIVECAWDYEEQNFKILRFRNDRDKPNRQEVAEDVWRDIQNPVMAETIAGKDLKVFRKYLNMQKKNMLKRYFKKGDTIMDWGSGRGGDIAKWRQLQLERVYIIEPSEENVRELEMRLASMQYSPRRGETEINIVRDNNHELIGAQDTEVIKRKVGPVDGIVAFSSLTYLAENREMYDGMLSTIENSLQEGGKFIGIVMDGDRTKILLDESKKRMGDVDEPAVYENSAFSLTQVTDPFTGRTGDEIIININDPDSMVKDQHEWLFYFAALKADLAALDIAFEETGFLDTSKTSKILPEQSRIFSGLHRYFVFSKRAKKGKRISPSLPPAEGFVTIKVPENSSSMIYAILYAVDEDFREQMDKYNKLNADADIKYEQAQNLIAEGETKRGQRLLREVKNMRSEAANISAEHARIVLNFRKSMSERLTKVIFRTLGGDKLAKALQEEILKEKKTKNPHIALELARERLATYYADEEYVLGIKSAIEYIARLLGVNIILRYKGKNIPYMVGSDKTIILSTADNVYFVLVAYVRDGEKEFVFDTDSLIIHDLLR